MTMSGIGTSWMILPKNQDEDSPEISRMEMGELRGYLCAKSGGKPEACMGCTGLRNCTAGQRAAALIAREVQQKTGTAPKRPSETTREEMEIFELACRSGNAWGWLVAAKGVSKDRAKEILNGWIARYPQISREYGGKKRLTERYRPWTKLPQIQDGPEEDKNGPVNAEKPKAEEEPARKPEAPETAVNAQKRESPVRPGDMRTANARKACQEALATGNFIAHRMACGRTLGGAKQEWYNWHKRYPDLFEGYQGGMGKPVTEEEPQKTPQPEPEMATEESEMSAATNSDEISLNDFLQAYEPEQDAEQEQKPESQEAEPEGAQTGMAAELNRKYNALDAEKDSLRAQIKQAEERIRWIEERQDALAKVLGLFAGT